MQHAVHRGTGYVFFHPDGHCYVSKQPSSHAELHRMIQAFDVQDVGCLRYKGARRTIQIRLIASGEGDQCDQLDPDLTALNQEFKRDRWNAP
jgi:hypothetical protein